MKTQKLPLELYDKLIHVFLKEKRIRWRKLIALSKQWPSLVEGVLNRMHQLSSEEGTDPSLAMQIQAARKALLVLQAELTRYEEIIEYFNHAIPSEYDFLFAKHWVYFQKPFFDHLGWLIVAERNRRNYKESEALQIIGAKIATMIEAYGKVLQDREAVEGAIEHLRDLLNNASSMDDAEKMIDELVLMGGLNPPLMLVISKTYSSVKHSPLVNTIALEIMMRIYFKAQEQLSRGKPPEVRILKHLLALDDPLQAESELERALTPGKINKSKTHDFLSTTPERLLNLTNAILRVHKKNQTKVFLLGNSTEIINPRLIGKLFQLQTKLINKKSYKL